MNPIWLKLGKLSKFNTIHYGEVAILFILCPHITKDTTIAKLFLTLDNKIQKEIHETN